MKKVSNASVLLEAARKNGVSTYVIRKRLLNGETLEEASGPLRRQRQNKVRAERMRQNIEIVKKFFIEFMHQYKGLPPTLDDIQKGIGVGVSNYAGRASCHQLVIDGWLTAVALGRYIITGSRWLDPTQNQALNQLLDLMSGADDPEIVDLVETLSKDREYVSGNRPEPKGDTSEAPRIHVNYSEKRKDFDAIDEKTFLVIWSVENVVQMASFNDEASALKKARSIANTVKGASWPTVMRGEIVDL